ncbi:MAG TPA: MFS transporter [Beijerinckiaceae bacterium]|nr:MFS transporter [Beijerinckiaceae bacterium]
MAAFFALCLAYVLSQFFRSFLAIVAPRLTQDLGLGPAELGLLSAVWFGAFAFAQFPVGWALDTLGARRTIAGAMVGAVLGAILFALAGGFAAMAAAMALIGIGCAPVLMGSMYLFGRAYPPTRFAMLSSIVLGVGALGNLLAATPLALAVEIVGWRASMGGIAALTAVSTVVAYLVIVDPPTPSRAGARVSALRDLWRIASLRALWPLLPLTFVSYAVVAAERSLWIGPFLEQVHRLDPIARGNGVLAMAIAMSVGAFAYGPLERLTGAKPAVLGGSLVAGLAFLALGLFPAMPVGPAIVALSLAGGFGLTYALLMSHARVFFPEHLLGRGITFLNFVFIGGAGLFQAWSGLFMHAAAEAGLPAETGFGRLHLAFGVALLLATAIYVAAPSRPARR